MDRALPPLCGDCVVTLTVHHIINVPFPIFELRAQMFALGLYSLQWMLNGTIVCSMGLLFAQWDFCLPNGTIVCSMGLLFAQWDYCLLNGTIVCSMGLLFAQWDYCLLNGTIVCPMASSIPSFS